MVKPKIVLLIFVSGKIVLTGAKVSRCAFDPIGCVSITRAYRYAKRFIKHLIPFIQYWLNSASHKEVIHFVHAPHCENEQVSLPTQPVVSCVTIIL